MAAAWPCRSWDVAEPQRGCHILYVSGVTSGQATLLVAGLRDLPVLTISDAEGFMALGGIAQFFFEHGRLRFSVDLGSAKRARLQISSRLLALAKPHDSVCTPPTTMSRGFGRARAILLVVMLAVPSSAWAQSALPDLSLEDLMKLDAGQVYGASERLQPVLEAPASVSFITAEEIARFGYRTLADILRGRPRDVRGRTIATSASSGRAGSACRGTTTAGSCCSSTDTA